MTDDKPGCLARIFGFGAPASPAAVPMAPPAQADDDIDAFLAFACTTCGRTDLPEAGDWDPPICEECDAAINFDAIEEVELFDL